MPRLCKDFYGISVFINFDDHLPPHLHAYYQEHEVLININDLSIYAGYFPRRALNILNEWVKKYHSELMLEWNTISKHNPPQKLTKPLL